MFVSKSRAIPHELVQGLGNMALQNSAFVNIGQLILSTPLAAAYGGTGVSSLVALLTALGIGKSEDTLTLTNVANVSSSSVQDMTSIKTLTGVLFFGRFTVTPTAINTITEIAFSLKYPSNFTLFTQAGGGVDFDPTASERSFNGRAGADITNDRIQVLFKSPATLATYTGSILAGYNIKP